MTAVRGTRLRTECPRRPCRTVPSSRRRSHQRRTHAAQRILAAGTCFMCPGGNPTDRRAFSLMPAAAMHDSRRALPAYTENQPKSAHHSPRRGVFDFSIFNYVVLTTEFGANSPNSPSRRFFPSIPVSSARSRTRVAVTQRHGCPADTLRASLADDRCFRLFDFQITLF